MITLEWGAATHAGSVRALNEDGLLAQPPVFAVADGMGGHAAGEVASALAVAQLGALGGSTRLYAEDVTNALGLANDAILGEAQSTPGSAGMGTTITGLAVVWAAGSEHWMVFNVGDSRVYLLADAGLVQLSVDHSEVEELVGAGRISRAEARAHPRRNVVTRSLGTRPAPTADVWLLPPRGGERFLLCSDGLVNELDDREIVAVLGETPDPQMAADRLVNCAVAAGGRDNVTVVVIDVLGLNAPGIDEDTAPRPAARDGR